MHWNAQSDSISCIEFYKIQIPLEWGKTQTYQGAVLFGPQRKEGCEVLRIITPMPDLHALYEAIEKVHYSKCKERLIFLKHCRQDIVQTLQAYCANGTPLPSLFTSDFAQFNGLSDFQRACFHHASQIPHGETRPYTWLACRLKKFRAERAVGQAMKHNPFPLFIPCHRVVKKDGQLGGYIGASNPQSWQLGLKKVLLEIEGLHLQPSLFHSLSYSNYDDGHTSPSYL